MPKITKKRNIFIRFFTNKVFKIFFLVGIVLLFTIGGVFLIWAASLDLPDLGSFDERRVSQSTKIYDRTGEIILYDVFGEYKRTIISFDDMSDYIKKATIAVEDKNFYNHNGVEIASVFRAIYNNIKQGDLLGGQGGSTITQQVIKNALLTRDKKVSRKLKEWILAPKLERVLTKDQILEVYLNEVPYGGSIYGIQEAARRFFPKDAADLNLVESAYLAAIPQAPTFYSPYGNNLKSLEQRKDHVLEQMYLAGFITEEEILSAKNEEIVFQKQEDYGIKAPHFVLYIIELLEKEFGREILEQGGLRVVTSLDWDLQQEAEEIVKRRAFENSVRFDAENASLLAIDPRNGEILVMVGSRDYFDEEIDGNYNITTANRQPGSTFKPIVYAEAFNKGYWPETVVFDLPTEFSGACRTGGNCYSPVNYDGNFRGPISFRDALAQSINVPAVKALYLAGMRDSLLLARKMGITNLGDERQYGLTLVLGGGEVKPIELSEAYGVFAVDGLKNSTNGILRIEDHIGDILYKASVRSERVMSEQTARLINDVLSDNNARIPAFGSNSPLNFSGHQVAAKTGTTNDYRDAWTIGYTPNIVVTAWAGNNNNRSMDKQVAGYIISPLWNEFMQIILERGGHPSFEKPDSLDPFTKPVLAGYWKGEKTSVYDSFTGELADNNSERENLVAAVVGGELQIHSILHWVEKENPTGPIPQNPNNEPQYYEWERSVQNWVQNQNINYEINLTDLNNLQITRFNILSPRNNSTFYGDDIVQIIPSLNNKEIRSGEVYINSERVGSLGSLNQQMSFYPEEIIQIIRGDNEIEIRVTSEDDEEFVEKINIFIRL